MWPGKDGGPETNSAYCNNACSDVVVMDDSAVATAVPPAPVVSTLNVTKSSKVHIGTKIVSVTQNVHNVEVVKGHFMGLELVSSKHSRRVRCSVAVFICWALLVATGLIVYLIYVALPKQTRLDIELPFLTYLWNLIRNSSRTERLSCVAVLIVLITCITLIVYFSVKSVNDGNPEDRPSNLWNITSEMWLAQPYDDNPIAKDFLPLMLVIVQHTVSGECTKFAQCAAELRTIQGWFIRDKGYNIPYNFIVGNDGRVYEGRGWNKEGAHTFGYNRCSLGIAFIGDYREERPHHSRVTDLQLNRTRMLLDEGVRRGYLRPDYLIVGAKDVQSTQSPGSNLHNALQLWSNFDHHGRFQNMNCEQIQKKYGNVTFDHEY